MSDSVRSDQAYPDIFPTASDLWRVTQLDVIVHGFGYIVDGETEVAAFVHFQEARASPCRWAIWVRLAYNDCAVSIARRGFANLDEQ